MGKRKLIEGLMDLLPASVRRYIRENFCLFFVQLFSQRFVPYYDSLIMFLRTIYVSLCFISILISLSSYLFIMSLLPVSPPLHTSLVSIQLTQSFATVSLSTLLTLLICPSDCSITLWPLAFIQHQTKVRNCGFQELLFCKLKQ